ncbi:flagellar biosynthesis anti-sigma factor FlgM [Gemmobacter straminiformis]|uniref:Negative regulator of flagellin synthesis n=2 Tax=Paragemmobacter straminiformis TaxID=2045119 RepID=A0A842I4N7_9RHOB|nr:flagellar biosynthesis anti-sigma factor FlgM [Gemmobacter straminiformis]
MRPGEDLGAPVQGSAGGAAAAGAVAQAAGDTLALSATATALPEELKGGPPIDLEIVAKIKEAISEGKYPIDLEKITESLFQDFIDLVA